VMRRATPHTCRITKRWPHTTAVLRHPKDKAQVLLQATAVPMPDRRGVREHFDGQT
jgi:hypothetical protein